MLNITFIVSLAWTVFWESVDSLLPVFGFGGVDFFDIAYVLLGLLLGGLPVVITIWDHAFERAQEARRKADWDSRAKAAKAEAKIEAKAKAPKTAEAPYSPRALAKARKRMAKGVQRPNASIMSYLD
jgi:hypothetical protein